MAWRILVLPFNPLAIADASRCPCSCRRRACDFISFAMLPDEIDLTNGTESVTILPENFRIEVNSVAAAKSAVCTGLGIQRLPATVVAEDLAAGRLIEVLPQWKPPQLGVFVLWPSGGPEKKLTRMLIDYLS